MLTVHETHNLSGPSGTQSCNCWLDYLSWTGDTEPSDDDWDICEYIYNPAGQRIAKQFDGETAVKYGAACPELAEWDGSQCIAEYDGDDNLLRKYIYGPGIDQPHSTSLRAGSSCMIKPVPDPIGDPDSGPALSLSNGAVSYFHYDGLGSVVALSDEDGDTIQVYEYDVYGNVAASDPNHTNPFMFTGRRFDTETGLYFYRARYYNPAIGRFLQTDPIGYGDGMNMYAYCRNDPISWTDPSGELPGPGTYVNTTLYAGGNAFPGTWQIGGRIRAFWLINQYFQSEGVGLWYNGGHAGDLLMEAAVVPLRNWLVAMSPNLSLNKYPNSAVHDILANVQFLTTGEAGYLTGLTYFFDDPCIKNLLGGGQGYVDGSYTSVDDYDKKQTTITWRLKVSFYDTADFHPDTYDEDWYGTLLQDIWNVGYQIREWTWLSPTPVVIPVWSVAQPYDIMINTNYFTATTVYHWESGKTTIESEYP